MSFERGDRSGGHDVGAGAPEVSPPGKRPLVDGAVQRRATASSSAAPPVQLMAGPAPVHEDPFAVHQLAERGIAGGGSALPHGDAIQRSFGRHDISGVQAHTDGAAKGAASAMGAEAFATGNHVAFGGGSPSLHTAAHEAAHVVQQRAGVALKGGVGEVGDPYERHADEVADAVVAGRSAESLLDRHAPADGAAAAPGSGVQMYIEIGPINRGRAVGTVDEAWAGIVREADGDDDARRVMPQLRAQEAEARATIAEWIASSGELMTNAREYLSAVTTGVMSEQPAQWRKYRNFAELAVAVAHEIHPQTVVNKDYEGRLAAEVAHDGRINDGLNRVKTQILDALHRRCAERFEAFATEVDGSAVFSMGKVRGSYRQIGSYKDGGMKLNVVRFLEQLSESFETNIAVIHDMMEHMSGPGGGAKFPTSLAGEVPEPRDEAYETTLLNDAGDGLERRTRRTATGEIDKRGMKGRSNVGTRDVKDIDTITGMVMNAPMLAGKSMTTARMMELVEWAGGGAEDKIVVAWAIFGYWKHNYPASTVPFHTFHEVMDIARNYGVPYRPFFYPDLELGAIDYGAVGTRPFNDRAAELG